MKYRTDDVVFASMDAQLYVDFCVGVGAESEDRRPSTSRTSRRSSSSRPEATYRWVSRGGVMVEAGGDSGIDPRRCGEVPPPAGGRGTRTVIGTWGLFEETRNGTDSSLGVRNIFSISEIIASRRALFVLIAGRRLPSPTRGTTPRSQTPSKQTAERHFRDAFRNIVLVLHFGELHAISGEGTKRNELSHFRITLRKRLDTVVLVLIHNPQPYETIL